MVDSAADGAKARTLSICRDALDACDEATRHRLECMLGIIAKGARLERYFLSAPADGTLGPDLERLLSLFDAPAGRA